MNSSQGNSLQKLMTAASVAWNYIKLACRFVCNGYLWFFKGRPWYIKTLSVFATIIILFVSYLFAVDNNFLYLFGKSPSMATVMNTRPAQASEIYSADSVMIGKFFSENRTPVRFEDVDSSFWQALIDTEDERFYHHHGIDYQAFAAALKDYIIHRDARGASTITQQLAKNLFRVRTEYSTGVLGNIPGLKMLIMKSKEWITAIKLEWNFSKEEILTMYANTVDFGSNSFGIKTACKTYFNLTPKQLTPDKSAILVGMLKATTYYNPRLHPDHSKQRRNVVLGLMYNHHHINKAQLDSLSAKDIKLDFSVETAYDGDANYFREAIADWMKNWCRDYYGKERAYAYYTEGLKIFTTIDTRMQHYAEEAAWTQMKQLQKRFNDHWGRTNPWQDERHQEIPNFIENIAKRLPVYKYLNRRFPDMPDSVDYYLNLPHPVKLFSYDGVYETEMSTMDSIRYMEHFMHCGFVAMEAATGHVKAWVGDIDFSTWKYDKVTAMRQPGSTFKLFVYTEAMNQGLTPCDRRMDSYFAMKVFDAEKKKDVTWAPTNANGYFSNMNMPLKSAFAQSINSVAVRVGQEVGIDKVAKTAHDMGIKSKLDETPSLALGSSDVNLLELVNSYATVVNDGKRHEPILITKIIDRDGNVVYTAPSDENQVIPYRSAFLMQQMLMAGMRERGGTSMNMWTFVRNFSDTEFGGKTGTSNNHSDAWFVGVSPNLVCGAWVGGEYRAIHFRTGQLGQGSRTALPICGSFYEKVLNDQHFAHYRGRFSKPKSNDIRPDEYQCAGVYYEPEDSISSDSLGNWNVKKEWDGNTDNPSTTVTEE
jgi:penicillin-binding protein 1A